MSSLAKVTAVGSRGCQDQGEKVGHAMRAEWQFHKMKEGILEGEAVVRRYVNELDTSRLPMSGEEGWYASFNFKR